MFWTDNPSQDLPCPQEDRFQCEMCHLGHFEMYMLNLWVRVCVWLREAFEVGFWEWYADSSPILLKQLLFPESLCVSWKHQLWSGTCPHLNINPFIRTFCDLEGAFQRSSLGMKAHALPKTRARWRGDRMYNGVYRGTHCTQNWLSGRGDEACRLETWCEVTCHKGGEISRLDH